MLMEQNLLKIVILINSLLLKLHFSQLWENLKTYYLALCGASPQIITSYIALEMSVIVGNHNSSAMML